MNDAKLIKASEVIDEIAKDIDQAKKRVCVISTLLMDDEATAPMIKALKRAGKRGVKVNVAADIFTYGELSSRFKPFSLYKKKFNTLRNLKKSFKKNKVNFKWLGKSKFLIFSGRTHTKWVIVDDIVYCFGGINLYKTGLEAVDYFFRFKDKEVAGLLMEIYKNILESDRTGSGYKSYAVHYKDNKILVDGGFIGDSLIYKRAVELAGQAKKAVLVTQYAPYGKFAKNLKKIDHTLYFNSPEHATFLNKMTIKFGMWRSGFKTDYTHSRYIHAKYIIYTMPDDSKVAISGSHNLVSGGGMLGTREIAIETSSPDYIKQLEKYTETEIKSPKL